MHSSTSKWGKAATPFQVAVDKFTDDHMPTLEPSSQKRYYLSLITLSPYFEHKSLQEIGKADLMEFVTARRKDGVSDGTVRRDLACLSSVFTIAADYELCDLNPVLPFLRVQKRRKRLIEADPRTRYLSHDEEFRILEQARDEFDAVRLRNSGRSLTCMMILGAIAIAIDTGLRDEELLRLTWADVDFDRSQVVISKERSKNKKERIVPLLPRSLNILGGLPRHKSGSVLWHRHGKQFYDMNHTLQRLGEKVGVTGIRWHDLRKTCGCRLLQDYKMPIERVSQWLGHSSIKQTQDAYAFLSVQDLHHSVGNSELGLGDGKEKLQQLQLPRWSKL